MSLYFRPDGSRSLLVSVDTSGWSHHEPAIVVLDPVLEEGGDPHVNVLQEVEDGVSDGLELAQGHGSVVVDEVFESCLDILLHIGTRHVAEDSVEMVEGEGDDVPGVVTHQHLVLDRHGHQVVQLVHAVRVELHDGGVRQLVKHGLQHSPAVDWLMFTEDLIDESSVEHG